MAYNQIFFAHKRQEHTGNKEYYFKHLYSALSLTKHCGKGPYYKVRVREKNKGAKSDYWGWKDFKDKQYKFIAYSKHLVQMASPSYFDIDIKKNMGRLVNLKLEEICEIK